MTHPGSLTVRSALLMVAVATAGCSPSGDAANQRQDAPSAAQAAVLATDDAGRTVRLRAPARRVLSLVPSGTEMVVALAGVDRLAGRTRYDDDPALASLPSVGGGLDPSLESILALGPDLVLLWESEAQSTLRGQLESAGVATYALQSTDTADVFRAMRNLGHLLGSDSNATALAATVRAGLDSVHNSVASRPVVKVFFAVGITPPMTAGDSTFVMELLRVAGGRSVFAGSKVGWPTVSLEEIVRRDPDVILLPVSDDPATRLDALMRTPGWRGLRAVREGRVVTVDANLVNRPGPRLGEAAAALATAIHGAMRSE